MFPQSNSSREHYKFCLLYTSGRIWVPKKLEDAKKLQEGTLQGKDIPEEDRDYYLERRYPAFGNLVPRDVASRAAKERCDKGYGVNNTGLAVFLDFSEAINRLGKDVVAQRYGCLLYTSSMRTTSSIS